MKKKISVLAAVQPRSRMIHLLDPRSEVMQYRWMDIQKGPLCVLIHGDDHCFTRHLDEMANSIKDYLNKK